MAPEANPNALDSEAIEYLGDTNKKVVMQMFDESGDRVMLFEMSVIDNIIVSNTTITNNIKGKTTNAN